MNNSKISVLVTGVRGFVGTNLKEYLQENGIYSITGSTRDVSKITARPNGLEKVLSYRDIENRSNTFDCYIHLAGKVLDLQHNSSPEEYFSANYDLTKKIFDRFVNDEKAEKFIFLSTIHALTESAESEITEEYKPVPVTPYGESKLQAEKYILDNCPDEKKVYILRPSMIHGPNNKGSLTLLYNFISKGIPYPMGAYNNKRSFVSVENLCFIIREIIDHDIEPGLYHIADDNPTYTLDLVEQIAESMGKKPRIWNVPPWILKSISKAGNLLPIPLNDHRFNKLTGDFIVSNRKIKQAIGKPLPVTAEEGIHRTIASFNEEV